MLATAPFWLGALLVVLWSLRDLSRGLPNYELRYCTSVDRYILGALSYAVITFILFFISYYVWAAIFYFGIESPRIIVKCLPMHRDDHGYPTLVAALIAIIAFPELPWLRGLSNSFRHLSRTLALYPQAAVRLSRVMTFNQANTAAEEGTALERALEKFGVSLPSLKQSVTPAILLQLRELQWVRDRFAETIDPDKVGDGRLKKFASARTPAIAAVESNYQSAIRRVAQTIEFGDAILPKDPLDEESNIIYAQSRIIAEPLGSLLDAYKTLIACAAISCFSNSTSRSRFIEACGYSAPQEKDLPYWTLLVVFAADAVLFLVPTLRGSVPAVPLLPLFLLGHAAAQVLAVCCAVLPKGLSESARPTPFSYPLRSYLVYGVSSFLMAVCLNLLVAAVLGIKLQETCETILLPKPLDSLGLYKVTILFSLYFPATTVMLSFLTDRHLRFGSTSEVTGRLRDAAFGGFALVMTNMLIRIIVFLLTGHWLAPESWIFALIVLVLGAILGALIPMTAARYLDTHDGIGRGKLRKALGSPLGA